MRRIAFVPRPSGFRFYHTHVAAGGDLNRGTYTGQAGPVYIEPENNPGAYDREVFLVLKEFAPSFSRGGDMAMDLLAGAPVKALQEIGQDGRRRKSQTGPKGYEVGYELFEHQRQGCSATASRSASSRASGCCSTCSMPAPARSAASRLPGHVFRVVALDGNPVPTPADVPVLWLGTAERISAIVEMNHPGVWVMGDLADDDRGHGMGIVVEYAGRKGKPQWSKPKPFRWDYTRFGKPSARRQRPTKRSRSPSSSTTPRSTASTSGPSTAKPFRWTR